MDMRADQLNRQSATSIALQNSRGETTAESVVDACLARIAEREPEVHAWAFIDAELALEQARARDRSAPLGPLHRLGRRLEELSPAAAAK